MLGGGEGESAVARGGRLRDARNAAGWARGERRARSQAQAQRGGGVGAAAAGQRGVDLQRSGAGNAQTEGADAQGGEKLRKGSEKMEWKLFIGSKAPNATPGCKKSRT